MRPTQSRRCRVRRSYTLIELIIVMTVLALAAALLVPHLVGRDVMLAQEAVRMLIGDMSLAQSEALAVQEPRRVVFFREAAANGYCVIKIDSPATVTPLNLSEPDVEFVVDPIGNSGRLVRDFTKDDRFEGVEILNAVIDGVDITITPNRAEITYDELGGTVLPDGTPGAGGFVTLAYNNQQYRIDIAAFTGKLTVSKL